VYAVHVEMVLYAVTVSIRKEVGQTNERYGEKKEERRWKDIKT